MLDFTGPRQQRVEVAIVVNELRCGLDANAGDTGHIVGRITGKGLNINHFVRADAKFLHYLVGMDQPVFHGVEHFDLPVDHLHQILVRRDDGYLETSVARLGGIGGDQIVGLKTRQLDTGHVEGAHRIADQGELRHQIFGRRRAVGFVVGINLVAKRTALGVKNNREMAGLGVCLGILQQFVQHLAKAMHRAHRQTVGLARQGRQRVIGTKNVSRAIDQVDVGIGLAVHFPIMAGVGQRSSFML